MADRRLRPSSDRRGARGQRWRHGPPPIDRLEQQRQLGRGQDQAAVHDRRLADRDRIVLHFTPTASSWLNLIERFFRDLTADVVREGSFASVRQLISAIEAYLAERNLTPKRYVWSAKGEDILAKILRARAALQQRLIV